MLQQMKERFPGISCAYMDAAGKESTEHYGFADREARVPVDENTVFPACSISKFMTAICVMKLHEQHVIDIDDPVNRYLHQWKLLDLEGRESDATTRSLLCHTAGCADGENAFFGLRRDDPEVSLMDILEGRTSYNNRPVRAEKPQRTAFEYTDAGYCVLQLLIQEVTHKPFEDFAREAVFDRLGLKNTFFASPKNIARYENSTIMATGYDENDMPLPGKYPAVPDLAASGLWSTPRELLKITKEFLAAINGRSDLLPAGLAHEMIMPVTDFPWTGLGLFLDDKDRLISQGWGENGQCILKTNWRKGEISVVMTNRNPGIDQASSGIEWLADRNMSD